MNRDYKKLYKNVILGKIKDVMELILFTKNQEGVIYI